jgi:3-oxoacyl-[acyl-carrier-protein] synthase II
MLPGSPTLPDELVHAIDEACDAAGLSSKERADCPLFLAVHGDPELARATDADRPHHGADAFAASVARRSGLSESVRTYTSACVAGPTAVADAAAIIARGYATRIIVAAGYLVDADQFALFDAGRALAVDGRVRPFSAGRSGLLLGDGVAAIVLEAGPDQDVSLRRTPADRVSLRRTSADDVSLRRTRVIGRLAGWGRAGDAYHVCRPRPDGVGLARAIAAALERADVQPADIGYVNAHGSGTPHSDEAETAALHLALGEWAGTVPVSSTKSVHGQALEAGGLLELVVTLHALRAGRLPVNAGYLGPDDACQLNLVLEPGAAVAAEYALSLNSAFGGANTALLVGAP